MAAKNTANVKPEVKAADTKTEEVKTNPAAETKKTRTRKASAKTTTAEKKTTAKTTKGSTKKAAVKETLYVQFAGKSYTTDELVKIARDVWKYDLKRKVGDFKSVELYVKPEESVVYYVINGDVEGKFDI